LALALATYPQSPKRDEAIAFMMEGVELEKTSRENLMTLIGFNADSYQKSQASKDIITKVTEALLLDKNWAKLGYDDLLDLIVILLKYNQGKNTCPVQQLLDPAIEKKFQEKKLGNG
jgi:hypothetical protein